VHPGSSTEFFAISNNKEILLTADGMPPVLTDNGRILHRKIHQTIRKVTQNIENNFHFNTAISAIMELFNALSTVNENEKKERIEGSVIRQAVNTIILLLSPMVPHFCAEMWEYCGNKLSIEQEQWLQFDEEAAKEDMLTIVIQVNGKVRSRLQVPADIQDDVLTAQALSDENVLKFIASKSIKKTIVVKKKLVNIVV
jgi:leucyl-tRNA synthetase